jgi:hypothetical protein
VILQKITASTRWRRGHEFTARGFSAYESRSNQRIDLIDQMRQAVRTWLNKLAHPTLLLPLSVHTGWRSRHQPPVSPSVNVFRHTGSVAEPVRHQPHRVEQSLSLHFQRHLSSPQRAPRRCEHVHGC